MLKGALLYLADQPSLYRLIMRHGLLRGFARRFVAGEELEDAIAAIRALNARGIRATLDHLGESVRRAEEAVAAAQAYVEALDAIAAAGVESTVSLKLTQLGLDVSESLCRANLTRVVERAKRHGNFVRIDMESSAYTQRTLDLFKQLWASGHRNVGVVIQAYLYRSASDVDELIRLGARVRLCKGAYAEPPTVAFPRKGDVDANFARLMERLLSEGNYPAIATHDERLIRRAIDFARAQGIAPGRFEFQLLYGIRGDLQERLASEGYHVRVYVPYGQQWYPYLVRRLAERPANLLFFAGAALRRG